MSPSILQPPRLRTLETEAEERTATWTELFYDLVFVVAVATLGHRFLIDVQAHDLTWRGFVEYAGLFTVLWWGWASFTFFADRYDTDDPIQRLLAVSQMVAVAGMAAAFGFGDHTLDTISRPFAVAYIGMRVALLAMYARAWWNVELSRKLVAGYLRGFSLDLVVWIISIFVPPPWRYLLWALGMVISFATIWAVRKEQVHIPLSVSHLPERFGLFTILVLGESIAAIVAGLTEEDWQLGATSGAVAGVMMATSLWWVYFDNLEGSVVRRDPNKVHDWHPTAWIYSHLPLAIMLTMAGIGAEELVAAAAGHEFESSLRWLSVIGVSGAYLAMAMILTSSTSSNPNIPFSRKALLRVGAAAAVVLLGVVGGQLRPAAFVILLAAITVIEVLLDLLVDVMAGKNAAPAATMESIESSGIASLERTAERRSTMGMDRLRVRFHGVRGSMPNPDPAVAGYGGDTLCIEIETPDESHRLLVDAGTGIRKVEIPDSGDKAGIEVDLLLTHFHLDHLAGLPFFRQIYQPQHTIRFYGRADGMTVHEAIDGALRPPWFPVPVCESPSKKEFIDLDGSPFEIQGLQITPIWLHHPQGVTGYRIQSGDTVVVIATDHESGDKEADARLVEAARGANLLIHDAQYLESDYAEHEGWGHSTWKRAIEAAEQAGVERLLTLSHDIYRTDAELDAIVAKAQVERPWVDAARVGMVVEL